METIATTPTATQAGFVLSERGNSNHHRGLEAKDQVALQSSFLQSRIDEGTRVNSILTKDNEVAIVNHTKDNAILLERIRGENQLAVERLRTDTLVSNHEVKALVNERFIAIEARLSAMEGNSTKAALAAANDKLIALATKGIAPALSI